MVDDVRDSENVHFAPSYFRSKLKKFRTYDCCGFSTVLVLDILSQYPNSINVSLAAD